MMVTICDISVLLKIVYMDCSILLCAQIKLLLLLLTLKTSTSI